VTVVLPLVAFFAGALLAGTLAFALAGGRALAVERRLEEVTGRRAREAGKRPHARLGLGFVRRLGETAPRSPKALGRLRQRLVQAGFRSEEALQVLLGLRVLVALAAFAVATSPLAGRANLTMALAAAGLGYLAPGVAVARLARRRQHRIRLALPDALDLLVVSLEAGLGLDQALVRVGAELAFAYPDLASELRLVTLELRAGKSRADALRHVAARTGVDDLQGLVTMLVQTDKFGTSVAQALRTKRRQRAEEAAAKTGVKMVFPLVFCIFPALWVVAIGPAAIKFVTVLVPLVERTR
jgi:tight adherence protein C